MPRILLPAAVLPAILGMMLGAAMIPAAPAEGASPIRLDKESYTWTDKVHITIIAPSWNTNRHLTDTIGGQDSHPVEISTRGHKLGPYRLAETDPNSGVFAGEVILTGFPYDADGDGDVDTSPRTAGSGPRDGFLESGREDGLTVSFQYTRDSIFSETVGIRWNIADVGFAGGDHEAGRSAIIRVADADMNINPETLDRLDVRVVSGSDSAGVRLAATETAKSSGVFEGRLYLGQDGTSGGERLRVNDGDLVTATYDDNTLPAPYGRSDSLEISDSIMVGSPTPPLERASLHGIYLAGSAGEEVSDPRAGGQQAISGGLRNLQDSAQGFVLVFQVSDAQGRITSLSWMEGQLGPHQAFGASSSWTPGEPGQYTIEVFAWDSLARAVPLSPPESRTYTVRE